MKPNEMCIESHIHWMEQAIELAKLAQAKGEVPVGALIVLDDQVIGRGYNQPICTNDPTAHAEIVAIRQAAETLDNYRLPGATLYVTIEPCTMCVGAMLHARIARLVFGAREPRAGAVISQQTLLKERYYNHRVEVVDGVLEQNCSLLVQQFFRSKRAKTKQDSEC